MSTDPILAPRDDGFSLSKDQAEAKAKVIEHFGRGESVGVLAGPAGSGKTTTSRSVIEGLREEGWTVVSAAPTGKAAVRHREVTGESTVTVHSLVFGQVYEAEDGKPRFSAPRAPCGERTILLIDEASMIDREMHEILLSKLPSSSAILYVGDREQLPPVYGTWGPDFSNPTALLTTVHRQALDNPVLAVATRVREGGRLPDGKIGASYERRKGSLHEAVAAYVTRKAEDDDCTLIAWRNILRKRANERARTEEQKLEKIEPGDRLVIRLNHRGLGWYNGEVATVDRAWPATVSHDPRATPEDRSAWRVNVRNGEGFFCFPDLLGTEIGEFKARLRHLVVIPGAKCIHVDWGSCLTVHAAQGSEWSHVDLVLDGATKGMAARDPAFARRLIYTAVTRAKKSLTVWDFT